MIQKLLNHFFSFIFNLCKVMLALQVVITSYIVFGRYLLNYTPPWGEPAVLFLMIWFSLLSSALAVKDDTHIRMSVIDLFLPNRGKRILEYFYYVLIAGFAIFMIVAGIQLMELTLNSIMPGIFISSAWLYASVVLAGISILFALVWKVRNQS